MKQRSDAAPRTARLPRSVKLLALGLTALVVLAANSLWPQATAEAYPLAQPSPRPTIDLTATALAQPTNPPGPTNTPLPPGPTNPPPTGGQASATAAPATATRLRPTTTRTPTAEPPTATEPPTSTATAGPPTEVQPTQTPWVIFITTTPQPGGGGVVIITVIPTLQATSVQPETPPPAQANWDWLAWLVLVLVLVLLAIPLLWLRRRKFMLPAMYPTRGRPRSTGVRPARGRERRL